MAELGDAQSQMCGMHAALHDSTLYVRFLRGRLVDYQSAEAMNAAGAMRMLLLSIAND